MISEIKVIVKTIRTHLLAEDVDDRALLEALEERLTQLLYRYEDDGK
jgi:hypothetical protein